MFLVIFRVRFPSNQAELILQRPSLVDSLGDDISRVNITAAASSAQ